jgi:formamidopyrimidine-DNA glycosylase
MPELPEVETIRRQLVRVIKGRQIKEVQVIWGKKLSPSQAGFIRLTKGKKIREIERRGKLLRFYLSGGYQILAHLKMSGAMLLRSKGPEPDKHTHAVFVLSGKYDLHWSDMRKFGFLKLLPDNKAEEYVQSWNFGPEPLSRSFTSDTMKECLMRYPKSKIKPKLLDQKCIAGIGNIYAAEALWVAKIHPETQVQDVPDDKLKKLHQAVRDVMKRSIKAQGTSSDLYVDAYGDQGVFANQLKVYGRDGLSCQRCQSKLKKMKLGGRGTVYCSQCQK